MPAFYNRLAHDQNIVPRPMDDYIKSIDTNALIGVEIGVYKGEHAKSMLEQLDIDRLILIDPYQPGKYCQKPVEAFKCMEKNLQKFKEKVQLIKATSDEAIKLVPNDLDFVYVDGNHDYEFVKRDLINYSAKLKPNGVIGGHDFNNDFLDVIRAVCEFSQGQELHVESADWWLIKA